MLTEIQSWNSRKDRQQLCQQLKLTGYLYISPDQLFSYGVSRNNWWTFIRLLLPGEPMPQEDGEMIYDVRSEHAYSHMSDSKSPNPLNPHTDGPYYADKPPQWVVLYCLREANCGRGLTVLVDGNEILCSEFSEEEQETLLKRTCVFSNRARTLRAYKPILQKGNGADVMWRYSHNALTHGMPSPIIKSKSTTQDPWLKDVTERISGFCFDSRNFIDISLQTGSILIWDNYRMLHYRSGFLDPERHLQRLWIRGNLYNGLL